MNFEQIQWNKVFCRMYGLAVIEVMTMSGYLFNIDEMLWVKKISRGVVKKQRPAFSITYVPNCIKITKYPHEAKETIETILFH